MRIILVLAFLGANLLGYSQATNIIPATPSATKMTEYFSQRPALYTGTANVTVPLYTIDFDGMKLPLSLSYNATGIRTSEEAGDVGLGWALNATGVISRNIQGGDDFFQGHSGLQVGYVYNTKAVTHTLGHEYNNPAVPVVVEPQPTDNTYYSYLLFSAPDTQPDQFSYNFFGYSGTFILSQKVPVSAPINVIKLSQDPCNVTFDEATMTFTVVTPEGYKGDFTVKELSSSFFSVTDPVNAPSWYEVFNPSNGWGENHINIDEDCKWKGRFKTISSWYLSKITSPRGLIITFTYDLTNGTSPYLSNTRSYGETTGPSDAPVLLQTVHEHVYLKSILSDEVKLTFTMEGRDDLRRNILFVPQNTGAYFPASLPLQRFVGINITAVDSLSTLNKNITFVQGYFNQGHQNQFDGTQTEEEAQWLRSSLDRVRIDDQEYRFFYDKGQSDLPNKLTKATDQFGFYNGVDANIRMMPPRVTSGYVDCVLSTQDNNIITTYTIVTERVPNFAYGRAGLLKKVVYPTQGYTIFDYEPHTYIPDLTTNFQETHPWPGGGARVSSIKEYDFDNKVVQSKAYQYTDIVNTPSSPSTGKLMVPVYNRYKQMQRFHVGNTLNMELTGCFFTYSTGTGIPGNNAAEGKIIGYSKVHEIVRDSVGTMKYYNTYRFENRPNTVLAGNSVSIGFPYLNGQSIEQRLYNDQGKIVNRVVNDDYFHPVDSLKGINYGYAATQGWGLGYVAMYSIKRTFVAPYKVTTYVGATQSGFNDSDIQSNGDVPATNAIKTIEAYSFNSKYLLKTKQVTTSAGDTYTTTYLRPSDYLTPSATLTHMTGLNMVSPIVEQIDTKNGALGVGTVVSATGNRYTYDAAVSTSTNLAATYAYNRSLGSFFASGDGNVFAGGYERKTNYTNYDAATGKLQEYTAADGVIHSFIWGYKNKKLPIVHGVGVSYTALSLALAAAQAPGANYELVLRTHANTIGKQVLTYKHNPLVGPTVVTDPAGIKKSFEYDVYGRLVMARDNNNYITAQNSYHIKTRTPTRIVSLSGDVDFGTLTTYMYQPKFIQEYVKCSDQFLSKILKISNTGEDDLHVSQFSAPGPFQCSWRGGTIKGGSSIDVIITFDGQSSTGTYNIPFTLNTDATSPASGIASVNLKAIYAAQTNSVSFPALVDFGTVTSTYNSQTVTMTNLGNGPAKLESVQYSPDNINWHTTDPNFAIMLNQQCFGEFYPSNSLQIQVNFIPPVNGTMSTYVMLTFDNGYTKSGIRLQGIKNSGSIPTSGLTIPATFSFAGPFYTSPNVQSFSVSNPGSTTVTINNVTSSNSKFALSPTSFSVAAGASQLMYVTYTATDFTPQSSSVYFYNNATSGASGMTISAQETLLRQLTFSPSSTATIKPTMQTATVYVTNTGNVPVTINGATPSPVGAFAWVYNAYSGGIFVPVNPTSTPVLLQPGNQMNIAVTTSQSGNFSSATGQLTLSDTSGNTYNLNLARSPTP